MKSVLTSLGFPYNYYKFKSIISGLNKSVSHKADIINLVLKCYKILTYKIIKPRILVNEM